MPAKPPLGRSPLNSDAGSNGAPPGALPGAHSSYGRISSQALNDEPDDLQRRDSGQLSQNLRRMGQNESSTSVPDNGVQQRLTSRCRSGTTSYLDDTGMRKKSEVPHANGEMLRQGSSDTHGQPNVRSAESSMDRSSNKSSKRKDTEEDPIDNSPYSEVRASVPATDDTTLSISTPRMWTLSLIFAFAGSATNLFFSLRYPSVAITPVIALILVHPLGKLWDILLKRQDDPEETFVDGFRQYSTLDIHSRTTNFRLWLGQGCWNEKEHACVYISSNVSFGFAFATDVIVEQHKFYKQDVPILYQILLTISTQIFGYAFAGLTRRFLVRPAAMIWPGTLMSTAMFTTMHKKENEPADGWTISRYRFFVYVWTGAFAWYFLPGLLFPALSYFNVITWFAPNNVVVGNLVRRHSPFARNQLTCLVWRLIGTWIAPIDFRLGANCIHWISAPHTLVGCRQCSWRSCACDVDHGSNFMYVNILN